MGDELLLERAHRELHLLGHALRAERARDDLEPLLQRLDGAALLVHMRGARARDRIALFSALFFRGDELLLFEERKRPVDGAGARAVFPAEQLADLPDDIVAMPRLLLDEREHQEAQIAAPKEPPHAPTPRASREAKARKGVERGLRGSGRRFGGAGHGGWASIGASDMSCDMVLRHIVFGEMQGGAP